MNPAFIATSLGSVTPIIFARKGHPLTEKKSVQLVDCISYHFLDLTIEGDSEIGFTHPIDSILLKQGYRRDIRLQSSQFSILLEILKSSDSLLIGSSFLMNSHQYKQDFVPIFQFEQNTENLIELFLLQHKRTENSAAHQWLKAKIEQLIS
jgi:DNA-binding transcriptional LysR family regulator